MRENLSGARAARVLCLLLCLPGCNAVFGIREGIEDGGGVRAMVANLTDEDRELGLAGAGRVLDARSVRAARARLGLGERYICRLVVRQRFIVRWRFLTRIESITDRTSHFLVLATTIAVRCSPV